MTDADEPHHDSDEQFEQPTAIETESMVSTYKVRGKLTADSGAGVLGQNEATSGTPIGVQGAVPNANSGYGLATPDNAKVGGTLEAGRVDAPSLPRYDAVGTDPQRTVAAIEQAFEPAWADGVTYRTGADPAEGLNAFQTGVLAPTGEVVLVPDALDYIGRYDPTTDTYTRGPAHQEGDTAFEGATLAPTGIVVFGPSNSANVGFYDPRSGTYTSGPSHNLGSLAFTGATLSPTGEVVLLPGSDQVGKFYTMGQTDQPLQTALHPLVN